METRPATNGCSWEMFAVPRQDLGQFLFDLPGQGLPREERVRLLREVVQGDDELTQEHLDHVLTKLLEEVQRED